MRKVFEQISGCPVIRVAVLSNRSHVRNLKYVFLAPVLAAGSAVLLELPLWVLPWAEGLSGGYFVTLMGFALFVLYEFLLAASTL